MKNLLFTERIVKTLHVAVAAALFFVSLQTTDAGTISGVIHDAETQKGIPFANIALFDSTATVLLGGTTSNMDGEFVLHYDSPRYYKLRISAVGNHPLMTEIGRLDGGEVNLGVMLLYPMEFNLEGVTVEAQRVRAKAQPDRVTFMVNQNMQSAAHTGTDILKLIPGVQLDIRQNVMLEGSQNIIILVNGRERDRSFISQLSASQIDKIEVINNPSARYDASVTGVINVILKQELNSGIQGQVYAEVPVSPYETFIFPTYNLNYGRGKLNFFTSYNGEMSYFDIEESYERHYENGSGRQSIVSRQYVNQKNWSHKFHYGLDYFMNEKNQFNVYGFYNPYSQEHSGKVDLLLESEEPMHWEAQKKDDDKNAAGFYSVYYKHLFDVESGHELTMDMSLYAMSGQSTTRYTSEETGYDQINSLNPRQYAIHFKADYALPITENIGLNAGLQSRQRNMGNQADFQYQDNVLAAYGTLNIKKGKLDLLLGMRFENSLSQDGILLHQTVNSWLPNLAAGYQLSARQGLKLSWRSSVTYPGFYQLNPQSSIEDPFTIRFGNPSLGPAYRNDVELEFSQRFEHHFISARLFYHKMNDVINALTVLNQEDIFEIQRANLGAISHAGVQFSGALSIGKRGGFQPYLKVFEVYSQPNSLAREYMVQNRRQIAWASGFSAFARLGMDFTASLIFKYSSPLNEIQQNYFEGAQYFLSLEKELGGGFKAGMVSAVPLAGKLTYQGSEIEADAFSSHAQGEIMLSTVPFWLKLSYRFNSGTERKKIIRQHEVPESKPQKGF